MSKENRQLMSLTRVIAFWRPGSQGPLWDWKAEYNDLIAQRKTNEIWMRMLQNKASAVEELLEIERKTGHPIMLGNDGRVWDGHHRLVAAIMLDMPLVPVEVIP